MLNSIKNFLSRNPLLQVTSFNSFSVFIKLISSFVVSKLSAVLLGTQGIMLIGNLRNILSIGQNISVIGLQNAVVKYTSETRSDQTEFKIFISTLFSILLIVSIIVFTSVFLFSDTLSSYFFNTQEYYFVFNWLAILLPLHAFNVYLNSILKGIEQFKKVIQINILTHILNVCLFSVCVYAYGLKGALMAVVIVPSASFVFTYAVASKHFQFWKHIKILSFSKTYLSFFGEYALMTLISAISFPLVYLGIRVYLNNTIGVDAAGYWEMNFRISTFYLVFMQSLLQLYILPKFVSAKGVAEFRVIVFSFYKQVVPLYAIGLLVIFFLRDYVVLIVSSEAFLPSSSLLGWQILADFFRVLALVMVYQFHAKKMFWHYVLTDMFLAAGLYFSVILCVPYFELKGVVIGHACIYLLYFILILVVFRKVFLKSIFK